MKSAQYALKVALLTAVMLFGSCAKDDPEIEEPEPDPIPTVPPYFAWQVDGGPVKVADSSFAYVQSYVLFGFKNTGESIEVNLSSMSVGNYTISQSTGNMLQYTDDSGTHEATGTFEIASVNSGRMSGGFDCTFSGSPLSSITGTFSEIPRR